MKKIFVSLGTMVTAAIPIVSTISYSSNKTTDTPEVMFSHDQQGIVGIANVLRANGFLKDVSNQQINDAWNRNESSKKSLLDFVNQVNSFIRGRGIMNWFKEHLLDMAALAVSITSIVLSRM